MENRGLEVSAVARVAPVCELISRREENVHPPPVVVTHYSLLTCSVQISSYTSILLIYVMPNLYSEGPFFAPKNVEKRAFSEKKGHTRISLINH